MNANNTILHLHYHMVLLGPVDVKGLQTESPVCRDLGTLAKWPGYRLKQQMPGCQLPITRANQFHFSHRETSQTIHFPAEGLCGSVHITVPEGGYWIGQNAINFPSLQPLTFILFLVGWEEYK